MDLQTAHEAIWGPKNGIFGTLNTTTSRDCATRLTQGKHPFVQLLWFLLVHVLRTQV